MALFRKLPRELWPLSLIALASVVSCAKIETGSIALTTGGEGDALTRSPALTTLAVDLIDTAGKAQSLARVSLPAETVSLPDQSIDAAGIVRILGTDAAGTIQVRGESLPIQIGALGGATLKIFMQRVGELARMPGSFLDARESPVVVPLTNRYVLVAGGTDPALAKSSQLYDLLTWSPLATPPTLPRAPVSAVTRDTRALLIDDQGASLFDLSDSTSNDIPALAGGSFAEVSGGATVYAPDGSAYVVGGTRASGTPTARVLRVDVEGALSFVSLAFPRLGASAAWIEGRGLFVGGGSTTAPGGEILAPGGSMSAALAFAPDASTGAGAAALDGTRVLLAGGLTATGGDAGARVIDISCASACAPAAWTAPFTPPLARVQAFALRVNGTLTDSALVVGDDATGKTHVLRATPLTITEIAMKQARNHARALVLPTGSVAIAGGATVIEAFAP